MGVESYSWFTLCPVSRAICTHLYVALLLCHRDYECFSGAVAVEELQEPDGGACVRTDRAIGTAVTYCLHRCCLTVLVISLSVSDFPVLYIQSIVFIGWGMYIN